MTEVQPKARFEFGRHETFAVRHGWLGKGLERLADGGWRMAREASTRVPTLSST